MDFMRLYIKMVKRELSFRGQKLTLTEEDIDDLMAKRYGTFRKRKLSAYNARKDMAEDGVIDDLSTYTKATAEATIAAFENRYDEGNVQIIEKLRQTKNGAKRKDVRSYDSYRKRVEELKKRFNL